MRKGAERVTPAHKPAAETSDGDEHGGEQRGDALGEARLISADRTGDLRLTVTGAGDVLRESKEILCDGWKAKGRCKTSSVVRTYCAATCRASDVDSKIMPSFLPELGDVAELTDASGRRGRRAQKTRNVSSRGTFVLGGGLADGNNEEMVEQELGESKAKLPKNFQSLMRHCKRILEYGRKSSTVRSSANVIKHRVEWSEGAQCGLDEKTIRHVESNLQCSKGNKIFRTAVTTIETKFLIALMTEVVMHTLTFVGNIAGRLSAVSTSIPSNECCEHIQSKAPLTLTAAVKLWTPQAQKVCCNRPGVKMVKPFPWEDGGGQKCYSPRDPLLTKQYLGLMELTSPLRGHLSRKYCIKFGLTWVKVQQPELISHNRNAGGICCHPNGGNKWDVCKKWEAGKHGHRSSAKAVRRMGSRTLLGRGGKKGQKKRGTSKSLVEPIYYIFDGTSDLASRAFVLTFPVHLYLNTFIGERVVLILHE